MYTLSKTIMQKTFNKRYVCSVLSYEAAMQALHNLQSNAQYLKLATKTNSERSTCKFLETKEYLSRSGITLEKLDTLSVIHVAGTKGKGSTCAYVEAILREHGFKTGFFSSPHLVSVRERIRINGQPLCQRTFAQYFWKIYEKLEAAKKNENDMPSYFKFLTILMFDIFLAENIDVAIIEVGIGGLYDCTNVVRNPVCVGITSLALDHTALLGSTIEDIAYHKSGIFKPKSVAFSVPQVPEAMQVLEKRAMERNCTLHVVPPFNKYTWENISPISNMMNNTQQQNASLAIQIATKWIITKTNKSSAVSHDITNDKLFVKYKEFINRNVSMDKIAIGLSSCKWPGRMQVLRSSIADFFLDGAHTIESIECCISWFNNITSNDTGKRFLVFNISGTRDPMEFLKPLKSLHFDKAYFVPNFAGIKSTDDVVNYVSIEQQRITCKKNCETWGPNSVVAASIFEVLQDLRSMQQQHGFCETNERYKVLVTGSLHLVGAVLTILDPNLTMSTQF